MRRSLPLGLALPILLVSGCGVTASAPLGDGGVSPFDFSSAPGDLAGVDEGPPPDIARPDLSQPDLTMPGCVNNAQCMGLPHATGMCDVNGKCVVGACDAGFADCDKAAANGCEVALSLDAANCGACGNACKYPNAAGSCNAGKCQLGACSAGFANCDAIDGNGCEVATSTDIANCGACAHLCAAPNGTAGCMNGQCVLTGCTPGFADCDHAFNDGCEAQLASDPMNCGGCMKACMAPPNAGVACMGGACSVGMCNFGFADCDKNAANGCEVDIAGDINNCGTCAMKCAYANATPACKAGMCALDACAMLFGDCDKNPANGCEKSLATDLMNCGACGSVCARANAQVACLGGQCGVVACNANFGDCNMNGGDGCETSLLSDAKNCGKCGTVCPVNAPNCSNGACSGQCKPAFAAHVDYPSGQSPFGMALTDVNGDNRLDVIAALNVGNGTAVHLGNGNGTLAQAMVYGPGAGPYSVAIADYNGDGRADIAVANISANNVSVLINTNNVGFAAAISYPAGTGTAAIASADFNGDGKPDLVAANSSSNNLSVLLNNGNGTFGGQALYAVGAGPFTVTAGDVNGDGKADLVAGNSSATTVSVLLNNGNGTFGGMVTYTAGTGPRAIAIVDVNGDLRADLVVANRDSANVSVLLGNGNGTFAAAVNYVIGNSAHGMAVRDFNQDGKLDIATPDTNDNTVSLLLGNGNGTFAARTTYATGTGPWDIGAADLNGDGKIDIVTTNYTSNNISVLISQCM